MSRAARGTGVQGVHAEKGGQSSGGWGFEVGRRDVGAFVFYKERRASNEKQAAEFTKAYDACTGCLRAGRLFVLAYYWYVFCSACLFKSDMFACFVFCFSSLVVTIGLI